MQIVSGVVRVCSVIFTLLVFVPSGFAQFVAPPEATPKCVSGCGGGSEGGSSSGGGRGLIGIIENLARQWERDKRQWQERKYARGLELNDQALAILNEVRALNLLAEGKHEDAFPKLKLALEKQQEALRLIPNSSTLQENVRLTTALVRYSEGHIALRNDNPDLALTKFQETGAHSSDAQGRALFINEWLARAQKEIDRKKERLMDEARLASAKGKIDNILDNLSKELKASEKGASSSATSASNAPVALEFAAPTPEATGDRLASRQLPSTWEHGHQARRHADEVSKSDPLATLVGPAEKASEQASKVFDTQRDVRSVGAVSSFQRGGSGGGVDPIVPPDKRTPRIARWEEERRDAREALQQAVTELEELKKRPPSPERNVGIAKREQTISTKRSVIDAANINIGQELINLGVDVTFAPAAEGKAVQPSTTLEFQAPPSPR